MGFTGDDNSSYKPGLYDPIKPGEKTPFDVKTVGAETDLGFKRSAYGGIQADTFTASADFLPGFGRRKGNFAGLPWVQEPNAFWLAIEMLPGRWNRIFPYRLLVIDVSKSGRPTIVGDNEQTQIKTQAYHNGVDYVISHEVLNGSWQVVLPITPQQLKITDQFAINTSATMRGIVEEHNGVKFKTIVASGTTGIWPQKPPIVDIKPPDKGVIGNLKTIFGGSIEAFQGVGDNLTKVASMANGQHQNRKKPALQPGIGQANEFTTGYYQALYLGQFFERYVEAKKDPANKGWRLVFDIPKQNQSFIVTPVAFESSQSEQKPNQYLYSFQLKAWKRIDLKNDIVFSDASLPTLDANTFQRMVNTISQTRRALSSATNLVKAVRGDFQKVFNVLRQTSLAIKDLGGLALAVGDLPRQLVKDYDHTIKEALVNVRTAFPTSELDLNIGGPLYLKEPVTIKTTTSSGNAGDVIKYYSNTKKINEGLSSEEVASGALGSAAAARLQTDPLNDVFNNPEENFDLFNSINVDDLNLNSRQRAAIEDELLRVRLLTVDNFRSFKQEMISLSHDIADNFGAGNSVYSNIYGLPEPKTRSIPMTIEENEILQAIFESVQVFDTLTATKQYDDFSIQSSLDFVGGLANESGINFENFSSKLLVPIPFGSTIEEIAARYMGDSSKWLEIVTLNGLRSPYIDETGFIYKMLSNAEGRHFNVDDTDNNLFIGQKIIIMSDSQPPISKKIINVEKIGDNNFLVTVDGLGNLDTFQTSTNARMKGYLPGTVNSQNQIYLPVGLASDVDDRTFDVVNIPNTSLNKMAKVDFLLTDNFDIAIDSIGDFRLASGLTNLIQALKLKIRTQKGSLLRHLDYGVGLEHGVSIVDIQNGEIAKTLNAMIQSDSRFEAINSLNVRLDGSTMTIDMSVRIANGSGILPISFNISPS